MKEYAVEHGLRLHQPATLKTGEAIARLREASPRVLVVAAYGMILPQAILDVPERGAINIHASLLPRWRGAAPIQRALLAGDAQTGISIMQMDAGLDTGALLEQRAIPIGDDDDAGTLHDKLAALGAEMMVQTLDRLEAGTLTPRPQSSDGVTYAAKLSKADSVLAWNRRAPELERAVRAFRPTPGASTLLDGQPLKIWAAHAAASTAPPGIAIRADETGILVGCGEGSLLVLELQRPGGRRMRAAEFLRGHAIAPGTRLG